MLPVIALSLLLLAPQGSAATPQTEPSPAAAQPASPSAPHGFAPGRHSPPCRNPDSSGKYHIGCGVTPPRLVSQVGATYSEEAAKEKLNGIVLVSLIVDTDGNPTNVQVSRSLADSVDKKFRSAALSLDAQAVACVSRYKFEPATFQGKPVPVEMNVETNFQIFK